MKNKKPIPSKPKTYFGMNRTSNGWEIEVIETVDGTVTNTKKFQPDLRVIAHERFMLEFNKWLNNR